MIELNEIEMMMEAIGLVMDEHGIKCADGHWMTNDELIALSEIFQCPVENFFAGLQ